MRQEKNGDFISFSNTQRVLSFLVEDPSKEFLASEIQKATSLSKAGIYRALEELVSQSLVKKHQKGKFALYSAAADDCVVKQFKVLKNTILLRALVEKLKSSSRQIILFGSAAKGEDYKDSDVDLLIVSNEPEVAQNVLAGVRSKRKIQPVIKTASQLAQMEEKNREFFSEINSGIVLWEKRDES